MDLGVSIERWLAAGEFQEAATAIVKTYGPEVLGFLVTLLGHEADAYEVFSATCEDLWRSLPSFERRASARTWFYMLARRAAARFRRHPYQRREHCVPPSQLQEVVAPLRSLTPTYRRADVSVAVAAIRSSLDPDDRAPLVLRVDRQLGWREIARVFTDNDPGDETIERTAARLRKRFQLLKCEIHQRAAASGVLTREIP